jgi:rhodanese-related sulfurtransferase
MFYLNLGEISNSYKKLLIILLGVFIIILLFVFGFFYYLKTQSVQTVTAQKLKNSEITNIQILQGKDPLWYENSALLLLDIRSREDYAKGHLKNSRNLPAEEIKRFIQPEREAVAIYSSKDNFSEVEKAADYISKKNKDLNQENKVGKIYIIEDGFEGLKDAGLIVEEGFYD